MVIETVGQDGNPGASKTIVLKDGTQTVSLDGLTGTKARIKISMSATGWSAMPAVQSVMLDAKENNLVRWSTSNEWRKATISGGLAIGLTDVK